MNTYIHFDKMHFYAYHGVFAQEQVVGNNYSVELMVKVPFAQAMQSDDLDATVNYAHIYEAVEKEMTIPSRLLEHVAGRIIDALKNRFAQIEGGRIAIYKETPPITGMIDRVGVVVEW